MYEPTGFSDFLSHDTGETVDVAGLGLVDAMPDSTFDAVDTGGGLLGSLDDLDSHAGPATIDTVDTTEVSAFGPTAVEYGLIL